MNSASVVRRAEITYRQMDYWVSRGYLRPIGSESASPANPGSGHKRDFSEAMMQKARLMGCLVRLGFAVDVAESIAQKVAIEDNKSLYLGHGVTVLIEKHTH